MSRTTARIAAMQLIFESLGGGEGGDPSLLMVYDELREETAETAHPVRDFEPGARDRQFIERAVKGVEEHRDEIEAEIAEASIGWSLDRISLVDRSVLMLATWELLFANEPDVPAGVAINEAVNLARRYSDPEKAGRFVNGILGTINRKKEAKG